MSGQVILRNQTQTVLYDQDKRDVQVVDDHSMHCLLCGQSLPIDHQQEFIDSNYFRLLQNIQSPDGIHQQALNRGYYGKFFREIRQLGRGAGGQVFHVQHVLDGVALGNYAVKKIAVGDNRTWLERMLKEVHILEKTKHRNIIEYKHCWLEDNQLSKFGPEVPCLFILMELANGGNLVDYIGSGLGFKYVWNFSLDIAGGLQHLHSMGILHRDLKTQNLLLQFSEDKHLPRVVISDFGECQQLYSNETLKHRTGATGTLEYIAPEMFKVDKYGNYYVEYSPAQDMWSLGMVVCMMTFGKLPYMSDLSNLDALRSEMLDSRQNGLKLPLNRSDVPEDIIYLIRKLLSVNPNDRPSPTQVIQKFESQRNYKPPPVNRRRLLSFEQNEEVPQVVQEIKVRRVYPLRSWLRLSIQLLALYMALFLKYPHMPDLSLWFNQLILILAVSQLVLHDIKRSVVVLSIQLVILKGTM